MSNYGPFLCISASFETENGPFRGSTSRATILFNQLVPMLDLQQTKTSHTFICFFEVLKVLEWKLFWWHFHSIADVPHGLLVFSKSWKCQFVLQISPQKTACTEKWFWDHYFLIIIMRVFFPTLSTNFLFNFSFLDILKNFWNIFIPHLTT